MTQSHQPKWSPNRLTSLNVDTSVWARRTDSGAIHAGSHGCTKAQLDFHFPCYMHNDRNLMRAPLASCTTNRTFMNYGCVGANFSLYLARVGTLSKKHLLQQHIFKALSIGAGGLASDLLRVHAHSSEWSHAQCKSFLCSPRHLRRPSSATLKIAYASAHITAGGQLHACRGFAAC
jgi:hypothetical protein